MNPDWTLLGVVVLGYNIAMVVALLAAVWPEIQWQWNQRRDTNE